MNNFKYENSPPRNDLIDIIKRAFINIECNTAAKREEWHRNQRPIIWTAEISQERERDSEGS
jgi:hypothetical protein